MDCEVCGEPGTKKCSKCKNTRYCSTECQHKHWKKHKDDCEHFIKLGVQSSSKLLDFSIVRPATAYEASAELFCFIDTEITIYELRPCPIIISWLLDGIFRTKIIGHPDEPLSFEYGTFKCTNEQIMGIPTIKQWKEQYLFLNPDERSKLSGDWNWAWRVAHYSVINGYSNLIPGLIDIIPKLQADRLPKSLSRDTEYKYRYGNGPIKFVARSPDLYDCSKVIDRPIKDNKTVSRDMLNFLEMYELSDYYKLETEASSNLLNFRIVGPKTIYGLSVKLLDEITNESIEYNLRPCPISISWTVVDKINGFLIYHPDMACCFSFGTFKCTDEQIMSIPTIKQWKEQFLFLNVDERAKLSGDWNWAWDAALYSTVHGYKQLIPGMINIIPKLQQIPQKCIATKEILIKYLEISQGCIFPLPDLKLLKNMNKETKAKMDINAFIQIFQKGLINSMNMINT